MADLFHRVRDIVERTTFIDTHEHLIDERTRLNGGHPSMPCVDWSALLAHYVCDDLHASGATELDQRFFRDRGPVAEKFQMVEPYWQRMRHTGYGHAVRLTLKELYGESDLTRESAPRIAEKFDAMLKPGLYDDILRKRSRIEYCHVNSFEHPVFHVTATPSLLAQDINITNLCSPVANTEISTHYGKHLSSLDDYLVLIDDLFRRFGPHASAVKCAIAYQRRLDFTAVSKARAAQAWRNSAQMTWARADDNKAIEDFLIRYCIDQAQAQGLAVKFHTGYHVGTNRMPLSDVAANAADMSALARDFPDAKLVMFHIGYPYQNEFIAIAKHHPNIYLDMCWAWIIDPVSSVQFLKSFLKTVPSNKVFTFGGDFLPVEPVFGHAAIARHGIARVIGELIAEGWLAEEEAPDVVERVMRGNALETFGNAKPGPAAAA